MKCRAALAVLGLLWPGAALAQERDVKAAEAAYEEAERLLSRGQPARACVRFADSYRLDPQLGALLHLADCNERIDKLASAFRDFERGHEIAVEKGDERAAVARERAEALRPRLSYLRVRLPRDAGAATVLLDGTALEAALVGKDLPVDRGAHTLQVTADGQEKWRTDVTVKGPPGVLYFDVPSWSAAPGGVDGREADPRWLGLDAPARRVLGLTSLGLGVVGLGVGTLFFVRQSSRASDAEELERSYSACVSGCDASATNARLIALEDDQRTARTTGVVAGVAGTLLLAGGAVLLFVGPPAPEKSAVRTSPVVGFGFGSVTVRGAF